jgi:NAD(P)-dependent dehydrogenase (short-subunit alcohol dehydrogenase family)
MQDREVKVAHVTGGTSGIGRCIAQGLREDGFAVVVMARSKPSLDAAAAEGFDVLEGDVSLDSSLTRVVDEIGRRFGRLDVLINSAGIVESEPAESITVESVKRQVEINLVGTILVNRAALPLLKRNGGSIVNFSTGVVRLPIAGASVYAATKAGVEGFSRALAFEVGPLGIRVNVVAPSLVRSNIWLAAGMSREVYERMLCERGAEYPLGRTGEPDDVAGIVRFLVTPQASWITGAVIPVDGGSTLGRVRSKS